MNHRHYLKGITSIRFILALAVVIMHCSQNLLNYNISWGKGMALLQKGGLAVDCFFILSGFLLTYLAFAEFQAFNKINIKAFFIRRILRIFPLYYLAVFLGYFTLGFLFPYLKGINYLEFTIAEGLPYHLLMLPNWIMSKYLNAIGSLYTLWSIGVEEQFYLFFPFLCTFLFNKTKRKIAFFGLLTIGYFLLYQYIQEKQPAELSTTMLYFLHTLRFHFMFLGGFFAILFHKNRQIFHDFFSITIVQIITLSLFCALFILKSPFLMNDLIYGSIFCLFLISIISNSNIIINFENKTFKYLGSISFGIYVFHPLVSYPLRYMIESSNTILELITAIPIIYYVAEILLTIFVAHLSYQYFEMKFLKMKNKYT